MRSTLPAVGTPPTCHTKVRGPATAAALGHLEMITRTWSIALALAVAVALAVAALVLAPGVASAATSTVADSTSALSAAAAPAVGQVTSFWTLDEGPITPVYVRLQAVARYVGDKCVVYVEQGISVNETVVNDLGTAFDTGVYPSVTNVLGHEPLPGIDGDDRITILLYDFHDPTINGMFRPLDMAPNVAPDADRTHSNQREMVYLNSATVVAEPQNAPALAAHELAHLIVYYRGYMLDPSPGRSVQARWVDDGIATYAEHLAGYDGRTNSYLFSFTSDPNTNLTSWDTDDSRSKYGAAYAFMSYLVGREGLDFLTALAGEPADGVAGINAVLRARGSSDTFDTLLDDWMVADFLDGRPPASPLFSFPDVTVKAHALSQPGPSPCVGTGYVTNFGAVYLDFPSTAQSAAFSVVLDGDDGAPLRAALISWDSTGTSAPDVRPFTLSGSSTSGSLSAPPGYDRHTLAVWARGAVGTEALYEFRYSAAADPPLGVQFMDLGGDSEFYPFVADLLARHIVSGKEVPAGSGLWYFMGQDKVLRAQFAKMIMEATGLHTETIDNPDAPTFKDVRPLLPSGAPDPTYDYVEEAASWGIVTGYDAVRFGPWASITRGQLALMIVRGAKAAGRPFPTYLGHDTVFADVTPASPLYQDVMKAYQAHIFGGSTGSDGRLYFMPWSSATRNHVAKMTFNLVHYLESSGG